MQARERLNAEGVPTRVVSMPCWEFFDAQPLNTRTLSFRQSNARLAIESRRLPGLA
jgi:transketolase